MKLLFAPMEGITYSAFRRVHSQMFSGIDAYCAPFVAPDSEGRFKTSAVRELLPENNAGISLIPQILCNNSTAFLICSKELEGLGYSEVNLNIGCPSGTVVAKHKGAGMLLDLEALDRCLDEIFSSCNLRVSIKTRMGLKSTDEFPAILEIYRKYPLCGLTVHARARDGMYKSTPDLDGFSGICGTLPCPVCYNGNIFSAADYERITAMCGRLDAVMTGRGAVCDPALPRVIRGGEPLTASELGEFHDRLLEEYLSAGLDCHHALARMKELWFYWLCKFPHSEKQGKQILKSRNIGDYKSAVRILLNSGSFDSTAKFNK